MLAATRRRGERDPDTHWILSLALSSRNEKKKNNLGTKIHGKPIRNNSHVLSFLREILENKLRHSITEIHISITDESIYILWEYRANHDLEEAYLKLKNIVVALNNIECKVKPTQNVRKKIFL